MSEIKKFEKLEIAISKHLRTDPSAPKKVKMTSKVKGLLPTRLLLYLKKIKNIYGLITNTLYDFFRVMNYSTAVHIPIDREQLKALIIINYHGVEKGLSLLHPRPLFGVENIRVTLLRLNLYIELYGHDDTTEIAISALQQYFDLYKGMEAVDKEKILVELSEFLEKSISERCFKGGVKKLERQQILVHAEKDLESFFNSRYSIRQFSDKAVPVELIIKALKMAQKTPSVCNRQPWHAVVLQTPEKIKRALEIQGGAKGFAEQVNKVIVVTSTMSSFQAIGERYQCWIDGGMFAMSVVYALHSLGVGTCCLNWSKIIETDVSFKNEIGIAVSDTIIMLIAVGNLPEQLLVAKSERKSFQDLVRIM